MPVLTTNVRQWLDIEENTGVTLDNAQGDVAFDAAINNATWTPAGLTNLTSALDFVNADGNNSVDLNRTIAELLGATTADFSIGIVARVDDIGASVPTLYGDWGVSTNRTLWLRYVRATGTLEFYVSNNGSTSLLLMSHVETSLKTGYHQIIVTRTGNTIEMFFDGVSVATSATAFTLSNSNNGVYVGSRMDQTGDPLDGQIAQFWVLDKAIDATEAASLHNGGDWQTHAQTFGGSTAPAAFTVGQWSIADLATTGDARITITALPSDGGDTITDLEYQLDAGAWTSLAGTGTGNYDIAGLTDGVATDVKIRAVNTTGNGADSDTKTVTTTAPAPTTLVDTDVVYILDKSNTTNSPTGEFIPVLLSDLKTYITT